MKNNKNDTSTTNTADNRKSSQLSHPSIHNNNNSHNNNHNHQHQHLHNPYNNDRRSNGMSNNGSIHKNNNHHMPSIWTTNTSRSSSKSNFTSGSNDFHFIQASDINTTKGSDIQNGSTVKLLPYGDDQSNAQVSSTMTDCSQATYDTAHTQVKVSQIIIIIPDYFHVCVSFSTLRFSFGLFVTIIPFCCGRFSF